MSEPFYDYYAVLGVSPKASREEIKRAWHVKMRAAHPDLHLDEHERYEAISKEINFAYGVLSDPIQRAEFDIARSRHFARQKKARQVAEKAKQVTRRERILAWFRDSGKPLCFFDKIILTMLVGVLAVFFLALIPWGKCSNELVAYLLGGGAAPQVKIPLWFLPLVGGGLFVVLQLLGKFLRSPIGLLAILELLAIAVACASSFLVPVQEYSSAVFFGLIAFCGFCVFRSFGERAYRVTGTLLRGLFAASCIVIYRLSFLVFDGVDELVSVGSFLLLSAFIAAWLCASFSSSSR